MKSEYDKLKEEKEKVEKELQTKNDMILALNTGMHTLNEYHEVQRRTIERRLDHIAGLAGLRDRLRRRAQPDLEIESDNQSDIFETDEEITDELGNDDIQEVDRVQLELSAIESEMSDSYSINDDNVFENFDEEAISYLDDLEEDDDDGNSEETESNQLEAENGVRPSLLHVPRSQPPRPSNRRRTNQICFNC